ncbi:MAG: alpha-glucosidase [Clostridia bacterium]|nr:alpha-glucosidase [Clostridia bacterium]
MARKWWQEAVGYEIYCKSFCDSDGDGLGDLRGVISKLPVLRDLGVTCLWFAPIYVSPQADNGYDVADYEAINPDYGDLDTFKELLDTAHSMGIRVIMDMVLNHSSDEHRWFRESRKSKDNPYRNYYIWQPPKADGSEPNNWGGYFNEGNGSAWQYDEVAGEYYLHQYGIKMPDLNWEYQPLREEIYKMLNWWLDFGVDGFRLDVITRLKKMPGFPDSKKAPTKTDRNGFVIDREMCTDVEGIHEILREINERVFGRDDCFTMGEGAGVTPKNAPNYILPERKELDSIYHFQLASRKGPRLSAEQFRRVQSEWARVGEMGGTYIQYLSNHDSQRQVSQHGDDGKFRTRSAKLLATLSHTTPGIPFIYQGEEIGMVNVRFDSIEDYNCCYTVGPYHALVENGVSPDEALAEVARTSRDNARTPYQWDDSENAGFTTGKPWLKLNPRYPEINLKRDLASPDSIFRYYQSLTRLRKEETLLVVANFCGEETSFEVPDSLRVPSAERLLTNCEEGMDTLRDGTLLPWEVSVYRIG